MMDISLEQILEALLLVSDGPLSLEEMQKAFPQNALPTKESLQEALESLALSYADHAMELIKTASGYRIQTKEYFSSWIGRLHTEKPSKYSRALLETLTIIAYRQPVTRADIEEIRGVVVSSNHIKTLLEREWIRIAGQRDVPGKPSLYVTTKVFLDYFNLSSLKELPKVLAVTTDKLKTNEIEFIEEVGV